MREMTAGAGDRPGLETSAEREGLVAIETIGTAVGPELALEVVVGNWIAEDERQREVFVAIARVETHERVLLVAVAIGAGVVGVARLGALIRNGLEQSAQLMIVGAVVVRRFRCGILLPRVHQRDVRRAG